MVRAASRSLFQLDTSEKSKNRSNCATRSTSKKKIINRENNEALHYRSKSNQYKQMEIQVLYKCVCKWLLPEGWVQAVLNALSLRTRGGTFSLMENIFVAYSSTQSPAYVGNCIWWFYSNHCTKICWDIMGNYGLSALVHAVIAARNDQCMHFMLVSTWQCFQRRNFAMRKISWICV